MTKNMRLTFLLVIFLISGFYSIAQKKPILKDDPINRELYDFNRLKSPLTGKIPDNINKKELQFAKQLPSSLLKGLKASSWAHRGPFNVGGRTRALAVDVNNTNIILAGGVSGGMWRSINAGVSWTKVTTISDLHSVTAIAQDTRAGHTNTWYYATGEVSGNSANGDGGAYYTGDGVFKSTDNGASWSLLDATANGSPENFTKLFQYCWNIKVSPSNGYVYLATYGAIYRSIDGGTSWTVVFNSKDSNGYSYYTDVAVSTYGVLYITMSSDGDNVGFYRSDDNGDTWTDITDTSFPADYGRTVVDISKSNEDIVFFLTHVSGDNAAGHNLWKYEYLSGDGSGTGGTWTDLSTNLPNETGLTGSFDSQGGYDLLVKVKPDDENFVIIGGTDLYRSTDGFTSTNNTTKIGGYKPSNDTYGSYANHHSDQHSLVFYPNDSKKVISGHDGGLSRTNDITTTVANSSNETVAWESLNTGYLTTQVYAVAVDMENLGDNNIVAGFQDNGTWLTQTKSGTANWVNAGGGDGSYCAIGEQGNSIYTSSQNGTVYRDYMDNGTSKWTEVDPDGADNKLFINPFILDPINTNIMYFVGGDMIWRNSNLTEIPAYGDSPATTNWFSMSNTRVPGSTITALDVSKKPANTLFFGTSTGEVYKIANANTGDPLKQEITGANFPTANIGCIKVNPADTNELFIAFTNYEVVSIWHSTDGGTSWESISGNLEENPDGSGNGPSVRWVEMLKFDNGNKIYFVGTSTGLYSTSTLAGENTVWTQESAGLIGNVVVSMIKVRGDGLVVVGTHANGVYSASYDGATSIRENIFTDKIKAKIYPNPSDGNFTIKITDKTPSDYFISIYNMQGKAIYFSEERAVFSINQQVELQQHAKGIYNVEIIKNGVASTYKVLLK